MDAIELLNVSAVNQLRREKGVSKKELSDHIGVSHSFGYMMFRNGALPDDLPRRRVVLDKLAKYLGVSATELTVRLEAKERLPA